MPKTDESSSSDYTTVSLPKKLLQEIDEVIKSGIHGYVSRSEFLKESARKSLDELKAKQPPPPLPTLEHFNLNETGVRILDRTFATQTVSGRIIDVFFSPEKVYCEHCQSSRCNHVLFALELAPVQEILNKKGWTPKT